MVAGDVAASSPPPDSGEVTPENQQIEKPWNTYISEESIDSAFRTLQIAELESKCREAKTRILSDFSAWEKMRDDCVSALCNDPEYSNEHRVVYGLWKLHYWRIKELRARYATQYSVAQTAKVRRSDKISNISSKLKKFLSEAAAFYRKLMEKLNDRASEYYESSSDRKKYDSTMQSIFHCVIYLGDLSRYKGFYGEGDSVLVDFGEAEKFYLAAAYGWPSSGEPHHQLAVLSAFGGAELRSIYHYFRSLVAKIPSIVARKNLIIAFETNRQVYCELQKNTDVTEPLKSFCIKIVKLLDILFTRTRLESLEEVKALALKDLSKLLSSGCDEKAIFGLEIHQCKEFIVIFIATIICSVTIDETETSAPLKYAYDGIFEFMALIIQRCCELTDPAGSFLLPGIMIFLEWLKDVMTNGEVKKRATLIWNIVRTFHGMLVSNEDSEHKTANYVALPEDSLLRGFLPVVSNHLHFGSVEITNYRDDGINENHARIQRIKCNTPSQGSEYYGNHIAQGGINVEHELSANKGFRESIQ